MKAAQGGAGLQACIYVYAEKNMDAPPFSAGQGGNKELRNTESLVSGHGFSRAKNANKRTTSSLPKAPKEDTRGEQAFRPALLQAEESPALAAEGTPCPTNNSPITRSPDSSIFHAFAHVGARLPPTLSIGCHAERSEVSLHLPKPRGEHRHYTLTFVRVLSAFIRVVPSCTFVSLW